ncbi:MBL fold metallo-hydrolase [Streptomyces sp. SID11385]|uniref:MBL fold metallo-hydrolase n=1 Tax=Streptomyces sp. SID11385 TaxID=2706031 RepID=UPI0013C55C82|nr:MBL fold metallo-hydrolase [Streptomyces sp. SID11385]NEA38736.1 MBL fold metallo-hydrolase [Streptomyces sp. SID11385]
MRTTAARTVAPGIDRLGDDVVNFYLVRHRDGLVLVDAGLPRHLDHLRAHLSSTGHHLSDISAVLLTHSHPDHTGLVTALHRAGAEIHVHQEDAATLLDGPRSSMRHAKPERSMAPYLLRRPAALGTPLRMALLGGFTAPRFAHARPFGGDTAFDSLPGRPTALSLPGHTPGSVAYAFPEEGAVFTGDALVTHDGITGHRGPATVCRAFTSDSAAALASLDRLAALDHPLTLPGHGEPLTRSAAAAAREAREYGAT